MWYLSCCNWLANRHILQLHSMYVVDCWFPLAYISYKFTIYCSYINILLYLFIYLFIILLFIYLFIYLSVCLSVCLRRKWVKYSRSDVKLHNHSLSLSVCLFIYLLFSLKDLFIYLFFYLFIYLLFICVFVYRFGQHPNFNNIFTK